MKRDAELKTDSGGRKFRCLGQFAKNQKVLFYPALKHRGSPKGPTWARVVLVGFDPAISVSLPSFDARGLTMEAALLLLREKLRAMVDTKQADIGHLEAFEAVARGHGVTIPNGILDQVGIPQKARAVLEYRATHRAATHAMIAKAVGCTRSWVTRALKRYGDPLEGMFLEGSYDVPERFLDGSQEPPKNHPGTFRASTESDVSPEPESDFGDAGNLPGTITPLLSTSSTKKEVLRATPPAEPGRLGLGGQPAVSAASTEEEEKPAGVPPAEDTQAEPDTTPARCSGTPTGPADALPPRRDIEVVDPAGDDVPPIEMGSRSLSDVRAVVDAVIRQRGLDAGLSDAGFNALASVLDASTAGRDAVGFHLRPGVEVSHVAGLFAEHPELFVGGVLGAEDPDKPVDPAKTTWWRPGDGLRGAVMAARATLHTVEPRPSKPPPAPRRQTPAELYADELAAGQRSRQAALAAIRAAESAEEPNAPQTPPERL